MSYAALTYQERNPVKRLLQKRRLADVFRHLPAPETGFSGALLDIGAGDGYLGLQLARRYPQARIVCYEPFEELRQQAIEMSAECENMQVIGDYREIDSRGFDYILCLEVLEHLPRRETRIILDRVQRHLHADGAAILGVPNELYATALAKGLFRMKRRYGAFDATWGNVLRCFRGSPPLRRPLQRLGPDCRYYYEHVGFDYRRLRRLLNRQLEAQAVYGSPFPGLPLWLNSEVYLVCRQGAAREKPHSAPVDATRQQPTGQHPTLEHLILEHLAPLNGVADHKASPSSGTSVGSNKAA